ncbi:S-adenosyl-L-methionine-dependent methyltransferase [Thermothelomyces heterothallicus CBS 203.75]
MGQFDEEVHQKLAELRDCFIVRHQDACNNDRQRSSSPSESVDDRSELEAALEEDVSHVIDLTGGDDAPEVSAEVIVLEDEAREYRSYRLPNGIRLEPGKTVQLRQPVDAIPDRRAHVGLAQAIKVQVEFVRIRSIRRRRSAGSSDVDIHGIGFSRNETLCGMLPPRQPDEVTMISVFDYPSAARWDQQHSLVKTSASNILCARELRITNAPFPDHGAGSGPSGHGSPERRWAEKQAPLVCRFRFQIRYVGSSRDKPLEHALIRIGEDEADPDCKIPDSINLNRWRGGKVPGGSHRPGGGPSQPVCDLESSEPGSPPRLSRGQRYTAGDVFSGAGGAARGIERAGVHLEFVVDNWNHAVETLRSNFPQTKVYALSVADYCDSEETRGKKVDLLHLSPPCQVFSPAHTISGKDDEANIEAFLTCPRVVERSRPRIFTVEETFGLLWPAHRGHLHRLIRGFVRLGYSLRWRCVRLSSYGVPQTRQRLLMIGSAPGEPLPPFPPYTHNERGTGGLKRWVTPASALAAVSSSPALRRHPLHRPDRRKRFARPRERWDPATLARTITCSGGQNHHWSGERDFTPLEYAVLQGFPVWHRFRGKRLKKQIGNAFPPSVVRVLYEHLVDWLLVQDGFDPAAVRREEYARAGMPSDLSSDKYVCLMDDDDDNNNNSSSSSSSEAARRTTGKRKRWIYCVDGDDDDGDDDLVEMWTAEDGNGTEDHPYTLLD